VASTSMAESAVLVAEQDVEDTLTEEDAPLTEELLVEEVSIDGMCGVY
jgi:mycofactocin precursor